MQQDVSASHRRLDKQAPLGDRSVRRQSSPQLVYLELEQLGGELTFLSATISTDLFGFSIVDWSRGTVGRTEHCRRSAFETEDAASIALGRTEHAILRRGYRLRTA